MSKPMPWFIPALLAVSVVASFCGAAAIHHDYEARHRPLPKPSPYGYALVWREGPAPEAAVRVSASQSTALFRGDTYREIRIPAKFYGCKQQQDEWVCVRRVGK